jgi:hypothetical protein
MLQAFAPARPSRPIMDESGVIRQRRTQALSRFLAAATALPSPLVGEGGPRGAIASAIRIDLGTTAANSQADLRAAG